MNNEPGIVYLLCYAKPLGDPTRPRMSAQHYVGWLKNPKRITNHENGTSGVAIVHAFFQRGIPFVVARTMPGTKDDERRIKRAGNHRRNCPNCNDNAHKGGWGMAQVWAKTLDNRFHLTGSRAQVSLSLNRDDAILIITDTSGRRKSVAVKLADWRRLNTQADASAEETKDLVPTVLSRISDNFIRNANSSLTDSGDSAILEG